MALLSYGRDTIPCFFLEKLRTPLGNPREQKGLLFTSTPETGLFRLPFPFRKHTPPGNFARPPPPLAGLLVKIKPCAVQRPLFSGVVFLLENSLRSIGFSLSRKPHLLLGMFKPVLFPTLEKTGSPNPSVKCGFPH